MLQHLHPNEQQLQHHTLPLPPTHPPRHSLWSAAEPACALSEPLPTMLHSAWWQELHLQYTPTHNCCHTNHLCCRAQAVAACREHERHTGSQHQQHAALPQVTAQAVPGNEADRNPQQPGVLPGGRCTPAQQQGPAPAAPALSAHTLTSCTTRAAAAAAPSSSAAPDHSLSSSSRCGQPTCSGTGRPAAGGAQRQQWRRQHGRVQHSTHLPGGREAPAGLLVSTGLHRVAATQHRGRGRHHEPRHLPEVRSTAAHSPQP